MWSRRRSQRRPRSDDTTLELRALLDFGASGARAMLVAVGSSSVEILGYGEAAGDGRAMRRDYVSNLAEEALSTAEEETTRYRALPAIADVATIGVSGPNLVMEPIVLRLPRQTSEQSLERHEVVSAFGRVRRRIEEQREAVASAQKVPQTIIGSELVGLYVGASGVKELPGPNGTPLAVAACGFILPDAQLDLTNAVAADLELEVGGVVPVLQAVGHALPVSDAVVLEVGHTHTGIGLVENRRLSHSRTISYGGANFTNSIQAALRISSRAAEVAKHRYALGHGSTEGRRQVATALESGITNWLQMVANELEIVAGQAPLPPQIFLFGGGSRLPTLSRELRDQRWSPDLFEQSPSVDTLYPHQLERLRDEHGTLQTVDQVGVAALGAWLAREPDELEQLLRQDNG